MTTAADDRSDEDAFEAYLAGRPVLDGEAILASFGEAVRGTATQPGRPNAALAELLATGLLTDQPSPSSRTGRTRRRRRLPMIFPALLAKLLSAGAVAQAATGAAVVVVVATGAGATGVLGADVQDTVTSVVGITSEEEVGNDVVAGDETTAEEPTGEPSGEPSDEETLPEAPVVEEDVVPAAALDVEAWTAEGPDGYGSFSAWVTAGAHDPDLKDELRATGRNFGSVVRQWAGWKGVSEEELAEEGVDLDGLDEPVDVPADEPVAEPTTDAGTPTAATERGNGRGNGNGGSTGGGAAHGNANGGNGNGNAGKGNGRN